MQTLSRTAITILIVVAMVSGGFSAPTDRYAWDCVHVLGSAYGTASINHLTPLNWWQSSLIVLVLGIVWEGMDELSYQLKWKNDIFDYYKGSDGMDIVRNCVGISISFPIRKKHSSRGR